MNKIFLPENRRIQKIVWLPPLSDMNYSKKDQVKDRIKKYVANIYTKNHWAMPEKLQSFTGLLDNEDDKKGDGLTEVKKILEKVDEIYNNIKSFESLEEFLFSTKLNPPIGDQVHQDMNAPLSHYFIHTSLNSYFTGNRVNPKCSIKPIIDALKQGVRVVELDLWPYGKDGICVRPSWNIGKPLQLQECLNSIRENAFKDTSSYPVIITFKDGLKTDLQSKATQMINQTFKDMLCHHDPRSSEEFPSPAQLENKILISRRPPKGLLYAIDAKETVEERNGELQHESADPNYQSLVAFNAVEPGGMLIKALTDKPEIILRPGWYEKDVIRFTQNKFLRTRPKRKFWSNTPYEPQRAWMHGAQMIALSRQDEKEKLWLMQGMFRANGGCGYVKKPNFLLDESSSGVFYPREDPEVVKTLKVKVYMGDGWQKDFKKRIGRLFNPDLYVMISIAGVAHDENTMKTAVKYNDWTPTWGQEFTFPLTYPDLALLRIEVYNHEVSSADGFCGQTCLPVSELIEGIRAVPLYDEKGEACSSTMLLIRFKWS